MKKIFTLIITVVISVSLFGQQEDISRRASYSTGMLSISSATKFPLKVSIDGNNYNLKTGNDDDIVLNDLRSGYHNIQVFRSARGYNNRWDNNKRSQLLYQGNLYVKAGYHVDISINRFGKAFVDEQMTGAGYDEDNDGGWTDHTAQPMNDRPFLLLKQTITNGVYDDTELNIAKQGIASNNISAAQAKEIVQLFNYDSSKLEIAKYAYRQTVDKRNYFTVLDALTFSSSKDELTKYMQQNP